MTSKERYNKDIEAFRRSMIEGNKYRCTRFDVISYLSGYDSKISINMARKIAMELYMNEEIDA